jgi:hypothetical protein
MNRQAFFYTRKQLEGLHIFARAEFHFAFAYCDYLGTTYGITHLDGLSTDDSDRAARPYQYRL